MEVPELSEALADELPCSARLTAGELRHEINNFLAVVIANASYVLDELRRAQNIAQDARLSYAIEAQSELDGAARRLDDLIGQLTAPEAVTRDQRQAPSGSNKKNVAPRPTAASA